MKKVVITTFCVVLLAFTWLSPTLAAPPIKVGAPLPMTGPYSGDGIGYYRGIKMAVDELNEGGGLLGRKLELIRFDTQDFAPERVMQAADQLVGRDKVHVVHGGWAGWGQDVRAFGKYDVPFFMWDASISAITVFRENPELYSNVFQLNDVEKPLARVLFDVMANLPYKYPNKKVAIITSDDSWGQETGAGLEERAKELGWEVALHEVVPYGTREWGPILTKIRAIKPGWIHVEIVSAPDVITFFRQFMQDPTNSLINYGYSLSPPDFMQNMGAEANGLMGETTGLPGPEPPTPEAAEWIKRFRQKFGADPQAGSFAVYTGVMIWAQAVRRVGDVENYAAVNRHIANDTYQSLDGWTLRFDADHKITTEVWPLNNLQVQDGKLVTIYLGTKPYKHYRFQVPPWINQ